jgi:iron complex outermembrane recepter protein
VSSTAVCHVTIICLTSDLLAGYQASNKGSYGLTLQRLKLDAFCKRLETTKTLLLQTHQESDSMNDVRPISRGLALAFGGSLIITSTALYAQSAETAPTLKQERIEVTGSNIKRADIEGALPVQVITAEEIKRSGKQTITEVLRSLPSNAAGGLSELTGSNSFSAGAASASLRGLGSAATLVLLNGRRIAPYSLVDPNFGQSAVVNLNALPLDIVERVEILKDGASAIYGSEAIAGVINIILRKDYKGGIVGGSYSVSDRNLFGSKTLNATYGLGDIAKDRYNVFANLEVSRQDMVMFKEVDKYLNRNEFRNVYQTGIANSAYSPNINYRTPTPSGVAAYTPGATCPPSDIGNAATLIGSTSSGNYCVYDQWKHVVITPKIDRVNLFARGTLALKDEMSLFTEFSYNKSDTFFAGAPQTLGQGTANWFNASTGALVRSPQTLPVGHPNYTSTTGAPQQFRWRANAVGNTDTEVKTDGYRALLGLKGSNWGWDWETSVMNSTSNTKLTSFNQISGPAWINGINNGTFNLLDPDLKSVLGVDTVNKANSGFSTLELKGSREVFNLPGGPAGLATGVEFRRETREAIPDLLIATGQIVGRGIAQAKGSRNVSTAYGELSLPVIKSVEIQLAARADKYSDAGNSFTPKIAASWKALEELKFRGSYAEGFRAPSLTEISESSTSGFFNNIDDPRRCNRPAVTLGCGLNLPGLIVASPFLKPEKAKSYSLGLVLEPTRDLSLTLDYFDIRRTNEITFLDLTTILQNEGSLDPRYRDRVIRDPANTNALVPNDPGAILYVKTGFDNLGLTTVKGWDLDARYKLVTASSGKINFKIAATYYSDQRSSGAPDAPIYSNNDYRNQPRLRGSFTTDWEYGSWVINAAINHTSSFKPFENPDSLVGGNQAAAKNCATPTGTYLGVCNIGIYETFDLGLTYTGVKDLRLGFIVRNITDRLPPVDPRARPYNTTWYSPAGRLINLSASYNF